MSGPDGGSARPGKATWIAVAAAVAVVVLLIVVVARFWTGLGDSGMSAGGWVALVLGVLATLALGGRADGACLYQQQARVRRPRR
jgi:hypothetical protein